MKKAGSVILILVVLLVTLSVVKNVIANIAVSKGVQAITGLRLQIADLNVGVLRTRVGVKGMKLFNPTGFPDKMMMDMPELYVDYDLPAFFRGKVHLEEVRLDLKEFDVVKNAQGQLNLDALKTVQASKEGGAVERKKALKAPEIQLDKLHLRIGKVVYKDYSKGGSPQITEFVINSDEHYENISNPYALGSLIVTRALVRTSVARLANFDVKALEGQLNELGGAIKSYTGTLSHAVTQGVGKEAVDSTKNVVGDAAGALKNLFK